MRPRPVAWTALALVAATAGAVAGCGSGDASAARATHTRSATVGSTGTAAATRSSTSSSATTATTTPNPDLPGTGKPLVLLGDMNTPQQFIIGELYVQALQAQGFNVQLSRNIGPTSVSEAAIEQGSLDVYPEYLNVYDADIVGDPTSFATEAEAYDTAEAYARAHGQELLAPTPFSETSGIAVLSAFARVQHLRTIADLARLQATLTLGSPAEFSVPTGGLTAVERAYGFRPALTSTITLGSQYHALTDGSLQAAFDQTTDWQLSNPLYTNLVDTKHVLGFGNVVPVVSTRVIAAEGPAFVATIDQVDALLTTRAIRGLTAETAGSTEPAMASAEVAKEFLQGYGIVSPPPWSTVSSTTPATVTSITDTTPLTSTGRLSPSAPSS